MPIIHPWSEERNIWWNKQSVVFVFWTTEIFSQQPLWSVEVILEIRMTLVTLRKSRGWWLYHLPLGKVTCRSSNKSASVGSLLCFRQLVGCLQKYIWPWWPWSTTVDNLEHWKISLKIYKSLLVNHILFQITSWANSTPGGKLTG